MSDKKQDLAEYLDQLPDADEIRVRLAETQREARLLRTLLRISQQKQEVEEAAALAGLTTTEFTKEALQEKAEKVRRDRSLLILANEDRDKLLTALESPPQPVPQLQEAFQWYEDVHERKGLSGKSRRRKAK